MNPNVEPSLQSVLPASAQEVVAKSMGDSFKSALKLPKGMNKYVIARACDRIVLQGATINELKASMGLLPSESEYVEKVIAEFRAWEAANKPVEEARS